MRDCVLLAAGFSTRFGENKLLAEWDGAPMIERALLLHSRLPYRQRVLVTQRDYERVRALAADAGFTVAVNPCPARGVSSSIASGLSALSLTGLPPRPVLFAMGDQPKLTEASLRKLFSAQNSYPGAILALSEGGVRKNPALFPADLLGELADLLGDVGGAAVIGRHPDRLVLIEAETPGELTDIDTK